MFLRLWLWFLATLLKGTKDFLDLRSPKVGAHYLVQEWDGSREFVEIVKVDPGRDEVWMQYEDGVIHRVALEYFQCDLRCRLLSLEEALEWEAA